MKTPLILLCLTIGLASARAEELLGAVKTLTRVAAEAESKDRSLSAAESWLKDARAAADSKLPPAEAATRWLQLVDRWMALSAENPDSSSAEAIPAALFSALPPPDAWDALDAAVAAVAARGTEGDQAASHLVLRVLSASLRGDQGAAQKALAGSRAALRKGRLGASAEFAIRPIDEWFEQLRDEPQEAVRSFETSLAQFESGARHGDASVPDLVTLAGEARAKTILARALCAPGARFTVPVGDATRALAVRLATQMIGELKTPPWGLIQGISPAELSLYEALAKRFPAPAESSDDYQREQARRLYVLGLIAARRTADAVKAAGDGDASLLDDRGLVLLERGGFARPVHEFLRGRLAQNPARDDWEKFIALSARLGEAPAALAFLRQAAGRNDLSPRARAVVRKQLCAALLAADEVEAGVQILRELATAPVAPAALRDPASSGGEHELKERPMQLARIGRLLSKPEWVDEGIAAARSFLRASETPAAYEARSLVEMLVDLGRFAEAEQLVGERWIAARSFTRGRGRDGDKEFLAMLAGIYHRANRPDDVLTLLTEAKEWSAADLAPLLTESTADGTPLGQVAAAALAARGRADEARRILWRLLEERGGYDPAYELLVRLGGGDLPARLDALAARDRFEERPVIWKAKIFLDTGRLDEAEKTAREAIAIDPSDGEQGKGTRLRAYAVLGEILEKKGDGAQAKTMREAVAAIRLSEEADDWWGAGLLSRAVQKYEEALGHFADAYCIQSRLALRYAEMGDAAKAEAHYRRAYELMPDSFGRVESHCFGCEGAFRGEQAQGIAERVFTRLVKERPDKAQNFYLLGYLREEQERWTEAAELFRRAVKLDPEYLNAWSHLASAAGHVQIPRAENEAIVLALVRLDPDGRRGKGGSYRSGFGLAGEQRLAPVTNFRALWAAFEENARRLPPAPEGDLFALPASRALLERAPSTEIDHLRRMSEGQAKLRTPGAMLARHPLVSAAAQSLSMLRQFGR